jgi:sugar/nucleoside kinase (ribokinase family)/fructoselysine-6-P-deglycase FrlB-like protein
MKIAGIGELIVDHVFETNEDNENVHVISRGGGTAFNVIYNLKKNFNDVKAMAIGVYGMETKASDQVIGEMNNIDIDTNYLKGIPNKYTLQIFQNNIGIKHKFSDKCIMCKKRVKYNKTPRTKQLKNINIDRENLDIIFTDKILKDRLELILKAKNNNLNIKLVLDVGRISYLRYIPTPKILEGLFKFDFINFNDKVFSSLNKRIERYYGKSLLNLLISNNAHIIVTITKGELGFDLITKDKNVSIKAPKVKRVIDTSGAGDSLLSSLIYYWDKGNYDSGFLIQKINEESFYKNVIKTLSHVGARGKYGIPKSFLNELKVDNSRNQKCEFCKIDLKDYDIIENSTVGKKVNKSSINRTFSDLKNRIYFTFDNESLIENIYSNFFKINGFGYVLGSGGSYSAAEYISLLINSNDKINSKPIKPYSFSNTVKKPFDFLLIISYSGNTKDYFKPISIADELGVKKIYLLSHSKKPKLWEYIRSKNRIFTNDFLFDYSKDRVSKERGFLSIAGTLLPSLTFLISSKKHNVSSIDILRDYELIMNKKYKLLGLVAEKIMNNPIIDIFGTGYSWPAVLDLESKLIEANISAAILHEIKDFSHGRFMFSLNNSNPAIVLLTSVQDYDKRLLEVLSEKKHVIFIKSSDEGIVGGFQLLLEVQYFIFKLSKLIAPHIDITKPKNINQKGLELYRWNPFY